MTSSEKITMALEFIKTLSAIAVPIAIAYVGNAYNVTVKDSENRVRYVELAIAQLRSSPTNETAALREWAVQLLDSQSPIKLSEQAKAQLVSHPLQISATASGVTMTGTSSIVGGGVSSSNNKP